MHFGYFDWNAKFLKISRFNKALAKSIPNKPNVLTKILIYKIFMLPNHMKDKRMNLLSIN